MQLVNHITEIIHKEIKNVWLEDISKEYSDFFLLREDSLKSAFYHNLRRRLGYDFFLENNIRIFTEYTIGENRIDLVIVEIDPVMAKTDCIKNCVKRIISIIEMKYKDENTRESVYNKDVEKVLGYIDDIDDLTMCYLVFIREKCFNSDEISYWLPDEDLEGAKGKLTELYSYIDIDKMKMVWLIEEH